MSNKLSSESTGSWFWPCFFAFILLLLGSISNNQIVNAQEPPSVKHSANQVFTLVTLRMEQLALLYDEHNDLKASLQGHRKVWPALAKRVAETDKKLAELEEEINRVQKSN